MNFKHKYFFLFPGLFVLIGILIFPIIFVVRLSLSGWNSYNPGLDYIGLENYIRLFTDDPRFWESFFRLSFLSNELWPNFINKIGLINFINKYQNWYF